MVNDKFKKVMELIQQYDSGLIPDEDPDNLYFRECAIKDALNEFFKLYEIKSFKQSLKKEVLQ